VTQAAIAQAHVLAGVPAIVLDPKGDEHLREVLIDAAARSGMPFREWSPTGRAVYNPFERGNPTEIADKAIAGQRWSEEHYREASRRLLGKVLGTLRAADNWPPTMSQVVRYMDPERLDALAAQVGGQVGEDVAEYVDGLSPRARSDLGGGRDRLAVLVEGELGARLDPSLAGVGAQRIGLERALSAGEVIYFHIDADRYPAASQLLAAALVTDLVSLVAELQGGAAQGLLVIDEFAALAAREVKRLFARARGAGLSLALGTQSLADLRGTDPDDASDTFTEQVFTNVSYLVVHREADPDSAERLAGVAGTVPGWSMTRKVRPGFWQPREGTKTREREYVIGPDQFKRLRPGHAVVIQPTRSARPRSSRSSSRAGWGAPELAAVTLDIGDEMVERIARRAAELLRASQNESDGDGWLRGADKIAAYIDSPRSRVYALVSARRIPVHHDGSALIARRSDLDAWLCSGGGRRP